MSQSHKLSFFTLTAAAISLGAAAVLLMEIGATSEAEAAATTTYEGPVAYLPSQHVNQGGHIEPVWDAYDQ